MAGKAPVSFSSSAITDLDDIVQHYTAQQSPAAGRRLVAEIVAQVERLSDFPESGRIVPEFAMAYLREIMYPPFRIVYRCDRTRVRVIRIWRSERLLKLP
jgi:plasmid stabilization system protein ParE